MGAFSRQRSPIKEQWKRTAVWCPLCGASQLRLCVNAHQIGWRRIVRSCDGGPVCNGLAEDLPVTHDALHCYHCRMSFSRLRESPPAAAVVDPHAASTGNPSTRVVKERN